MNNDTIKGKYFYDLSTGSTIGVKHGEKLNSMESDGIEDVTSTTTYKGQEFDILGANTVESITCGTVEDLSFEQIMTLYMQGDLTFDECLIGLKSKGINPNCSSGAVGQSIYFNYNNKSYNIECSSLARQSQLDNHKSELYTKQDLIDKFGVKESDIDEYFCAASSVDGKATTYVMREDHLFLDASTHNIEDLMNNSTYVNWCDHSDCLFELVGLSLSENGKKSIEDAVTMNSDGSATVKFINGSWNGGTANIATTFSAGDVAKAKELLSSHPEYNNNINLLLMDMGLARWNEEAIDKCNQYFEDNPSANRNETRYGDVFGIEKMNLYGIDSYHLECTNIRHVSGVSLTKTSRVMAKPYVCFARGTVATSNDYGYSEFGCYYGNPTTKADNKIDEYKIWYYEQLNAFRQMKEAGIDSIMEFAPAEAFMTVEGVSLYEECFIQNIDDDYIYITPRTDTENTYRVSIDDYINSMKNHGQGGNALARYYCYPEALLWNTIVEPNWKSKVNDYIAQNGKHNYYQDKIDALLSSGGATQTPTSTPTTPTSGTPSIGTTSNPTPSHGPQSSGSKGGGTATSPETQTPNNSSSYGNTQTGADGSIRPVTNSTTQKPTYDTAKAGNVPTGTYTDDLVAKLKADDIEKFKNELPSEFWPELKVTVNNDGKIVFSDEFKEYLETLPALADKYDREGVWPGTVQKLRNFYSIMSGKNDGDMSVEEFYDALGENHINSDPSTFTHQTRCHDSEYFQNSARLYTLGEQVKENYPDLYNSPFFSWLQDPIHIYSQETELIMSTDVSSIASMLSDYSEISYDYDIVNVIAMAAGINATDSPATKADKYRNACEKMGMNQKRYIDKADVYRYLLGNNDEKVNWFQTYLNRADAIRNAENEIIKPTPTGNEVYDPSINVAEGKTYANSGRDCQDYEIGSAEGAKFVRNEEGVNLAKEIESYIISLTEDLYDKWYEYHPGSGGGFVHFNGFGYGDAGKENSVKWKSEAEKQACFKDFNRCAQQILNKYGDKLTNLSFDGFFYTFYLDGVRNCIAVPGNNENRRVYSHELEPCCDKVISYTNVEVYDNDPPQALPAVPSEWGTPVKTKWDGILVSENSVFYWNAKENQYVRYDASPEMVSSLLKGEDRYINPGNMDTIGGNNYNYRNMEKYRTLFALTHGFHATSSPNIYEKDGKFYSFDQTSSGTFGGKKDRMGQSWVLLETEFNPSVKNEVSTSTHATDGTLTQSAPAYASATPIKPASPTIQTTPAKAPVTITIEKFKLSDEQSVSNIGVRVFEEQGTDLLNQYKSMSGTLNSTAGATWMLRHDKAYGFENILEEPKMFDSITVRRYLDDQAAFCLAYFGYEISDEHPSGTIYQTLTSEQRNFVYAHPEIFHYIGNPNEEDNFYNPYGSTEGNYEFFPDAVMTEYILEQFKKNNHYISPDMQYCVKLNNFKNDININNSRMIQCLQLGDNNVTWNDNTVNAFYEYLQNNKGYENLKVYKGTMDDYNKKCWEKVLDMLSISFSDVTNLSEMQLKEKITAGLENHFKNCGSSDGKTLHIEDYYNSLSPLVDTYADFYKVYEEQEVQLQYIANVESELYAQQGGGVNPADYNKNRGIIKQKEVSNVTATSSQQTELNSYEECQAMLILSNFLNANISPSGNSNLYSANKEELYNTWSRLADGTRLTENNWQLYKNQIPTLNKTEAIEEAIEKLMMHSCQLDSLTATEQNPQKVISEWLNDLLNAIGAKNVKIASYGKDAGGVTYSYAYVRPAYITFDLNGKKYEMAVKQPATGAPPPTSAIVTSDQVEELRQYMPEDEFERVLNYYFTPVFTVDGKAQSYMFSWTLDVAGEKRKYGEDPKYVRGNYINGSFMHFEDYWRGTRSDNCTSTGFEEMVKWLKENDVFAMSGTTKPKNATQSAPATASNADVEFAPSTNSDDTQETVISQDDYKKEAEDNIEALQKKVGNVIKDGDSYYNSFNGKQYNYMWDPFNHKWLAYEPSQIVNGVAKDQNNPILVRIQMIVAALAQGLSFTANPKVCKDKDGNVYEFNEVSCAFEKQA